jgi:hypothetical protein
MVMENTVSTSPVPADVHHPGHHHNCAVSWGAILGGAAAAAALSLILLSLGSGIGLASFNPFSGDRESIASFTGKMAAWMVAMQWFSAGLGGYIAGRLRSRTPVNGNDEVFFRDTAHGFLAWTVATLFTAALLASATTALLGAGGKAATAVAAAGAAGGGAAMAKEGPAVPGKPGPDAPGFDLLSYNVDALLRNTAPVTGGPVENTHREVTGIIRHGLMEDEFPQADREYLARLVAANAAISPEEAATRVDSAVTQLQAAKAEAKETAEKARKASATFSLITALSLLVGAFIAAVAAALGGRDRDDPRYCDPLRK